MKGKWFFSMLCAFILGLGWSLVWSDEPPQFPQNATFTTLNFPQSGGEINAGVVGSRGKISCTDQELIIQGLPLPIR